MENNNLTEQCKDCIFLLDINCHPSNGDNKLYGFLEDDFKIGNGSINKRMAFGCMVRCEETLKDSDDYITYFDFNNGSCELFTSKYKYKLVVKAEEL